MKTKNETDMAIIISSPDSYGDIFGVFIDLLNRNWTNCSYKVVLSNNNKQWDCPKLMVVNNGEDVAWSNRVLHAARKVSAKYILLITDDSLISSPVDSVEFEKIVKFMKDNSLKYYRLYTSPKATEKNYKGINYIHYISKQQPYGLNLMAAIWDKEYFIESFGDKDYSGWDIEGTWLRKTVNAPDENFHGCVVDTRNILHIVHGVYKGKWMPSAILKFRKKGYTIDVGERGAISISQEFILKLKRFFRNLLSAQSRRRIKTILSKFGINFATRY